MTLVGMYAETSPACVSMIGSAGQAAAAQFVGELRRTLEQSAVQIEDVARIRFTPRRSSQQQRHGTVGDRVLGQIVVDDQHVLALVHEVLAHRAACVRGDVLDRRNVGSRRRNNDRLLHNAFVFECLDQLCHGGLLLPDGNIDTDDVRIFLVEDGVDRDRGLTGLTVADDQLALPAADRDHAVDSLKTCLQRLLDGLSLQNARRRIFDRSGLFRLDRALAVDRLSECIDNASDERIADRHFNNGAGRLDDVSLFDTFVGSQNNAAHVVLFQVHGHAVDPVRELQQFTGHAVVQSIDAGDAVTDLDDGPEIRYFHPVFVLLDLLTDHSTDFFRPDVH